MRNHRRNQNLKRIQIFLLKRLSWGKEWSSKVIKIHFNLLKYDEKRKWLSYPKRPVLFILQYAITKSGKFVLLDWRTNFIRNSRSIKRRKMSMKNIIKNALCLFLINKNNNEEENIRNGMEIVLNNSVRFFSVLSRLN